MNKIIRPSQSFDPYLLLLIGVLLTLGVLMVATSSLFVSTRYHTHAASFFMKHTIHLMVGLLVFLMGLRVPICFYQRYGFLSFLLAFFMLIVVLVPGLSPAINGAHRWLKLPGFMLQTSDVAKLALLIYIAQYFAKRIDKKMMSSDDWIFIFVIAVFAVVLLLLQPDFGSSVVLMSMVLGLLVLAELPLLWLGAVVLVVGVMAMLLVWIEPYRFARVVSFLDPWKHAQGSGYQLTQALMAIGRGGFFGVGLGNGLQKIMYLPEAHTDFIFAVLCEELGIVSGFILVFIYYCVFVRLMFWSWQGYLCRQYFIQYYLFGLGLWFSGQAFISVGVSMGYLPTKGLVLPFISYGGSASVVFLLAWGIAFQCIKRIQYLR